MSDPLHVELAELRARTGAKWSRYPADVLPAWVADMDLPVAPPVRRAVAELVERSELGYPAFQGRTGVPQAFARRAAARWGWTLDPDLVHLLPNVMTGVAHAIEALTEPGDVVAYPVPVYHPFHDVIPHTRRVPAPVPLDAGGRLDLDGLGAALRAGARAVLLCHPHNPTGTVHRAAELAELGRLLAEHGASLISDEVHAELTFAPAVHVPAAAIDADLAARTVTVTSASKAFNIAGLRCALAVSGTAAGHQRFGGAAEMTLHTVGSLGITATLAAWTPEGDAWLAACLRLLASNRSHLAERVATDLPGVVLHPAEATYLAWLDCEGTGLERPAKWFLDRARVALSPGDEFGGPATARFVRLNLATTPEVLDLVLDRMAEALAAAR